MQLKHAYIKMHYYGNKFPKLPSAADSALDPQYSTTRKRARPHFQGRS